MSLEKFEIFVKVVELKSFTKAAEFLGYTQSGVSHAINSLEKDFGFQLFIRNRTGLKLTHNGETVLIYIRDLIKSNEQLLATVSSINKVNKGKIKIGTFPSVSTNWLPSIIQNFRSDYPNIDIDLLDGEYDEIREWIKDYTVDCGFVLCDTPDDRLDVTHLLKDPQLIVLPPGHELCQYDRIPVDKLNGTNIILPKEGTDYHIGKLIEKYNLDINVSCFSTNNFTTIAMVKSDLGYSILPELFIKNLKGELVLKQLDVPFYRYLGFGVLNNRKLSPALNVFKNYVVDYVNTTK
ncbi:DNA-binding transcriptional regulator, LysR family [Dethiosulfatibacter aminovorans DSM 17477]|uniref:DNA-binding transcriptional regulator, LysR family n=1 Tax=Dethiosulfatibacter aminovorans DSM 17477 TaxID=1121476 RepID=A0A1M6E5B6_9FIRM|nr:LysR family transcriptional regulator [Dethiosulfatibacter aminovorans]SHI80559.1 DNA-binding transcriptional regulator, LysR family [Dethiosulfatibacter aminovorans DSM 17477]